MIQGREYLTTITMPSIIDTEGDRIEIEVQNYKGKLWKFSSSTGWNDKNSEFPVWINFNNVPFFEVVINH